MLRHAVPHVSAAAHVVADLQSDNVNVNLAAIIVVFAYLNLDLSAL